MNKVIKNEKGITLIALVITIIVMLILAGVSIAMLTGDNGVLTQAGNAKENTRMAAIQEEIRLATYENKIAEHSEGEKVTKESLVEKLKNDGLITEEEENQLLGKNGQEEIDRIKIDGIECDFSELNSKKLITFYIYLYDVTKAFTVEEGTTRKQFAESNDDYMWKTEEEYIELGCPLGGTWDGPPVDGEAYPGEVFWGSAIIDENTGAIVMPAGAPIFELGGNYIDGPFAIANEPIKAGVTYDCTR